MDWLTEVVCDPVTLRPLVKEGDELVERESGARYPIREGIPVFFGGAVEGLNAKYQKMYDRLAPGYDLAERLYYMVTRKRDVREEFLCELEVGAGARVLEVSVGTGANARRLLFASQDIAFYGLDLSRGMLQRCQRSLTKDGRAGRFALFEGEAEHLPFRSESFDCVFHVGGINFFNDKGRAMREMVRVAKPGVKIVVVDETEKVVKGMYEKMPGTAGYFGEKERGMTGVPVELVPEGGTEVRVKDIGGGKMWCLGWRRG